MNENSRLSLVVFLAGAGLGGDHGRVGRRDGGTFSLGRINALFFIGKIAGVELVARIR